MTIVSSSVDGALDIFRVNIVPHFWLIVGAMFEWERVWKRTQIKTTFLQLVRDSEDNQRKCWLRL